MLSRYGNILTSIKDDARFSKIGTDPRFRLPSKRTTHVTLDKRFAHMLRDDDFSKRAVVDRYGRKIPKASGKRDLERFYRLEDEKEEGDDEDNYAKSQYNQEDDDLVQQELVRAERDYDPAREGGFQSSDDSSSEESEDAGITTQDEGLYTFPDIQRERRDGVPMGDISSRLAVVNLDWDNIRAVDLMAVFSSFCPPTGRLLRVTVYPSHFGKERMEREQVEGPPKEIFASKGPGSAGEPLEEQDFEEQEGEEGDDDEEKKIKESLLLEDKGEEFDSTKLRRYQLERLRYYYAVLTFTSAETAKAIYDATDGTEYLTTANFFDLRFVSDDVSFEDDQTWDECSIIPDGYKPNTFVTDALQHSKVKLTWDAEDNVRKEVVRKAFSGSRADIEENDLKAYLGSDSSGDEDQLDPAMSNAEHKDREIRLSRKERERQRLRAALGLLNAPDTSKTHSRRAPVGDMQITFTTGLAGSSTADKVLGSGHGHEETTVEKYIRKEKERKHKRKEKAIAARDGSGDDDVQLAGTQSPEDSLGSLGKVENADDGPNAAENDEEPDLGFDDPFFTAADESVHLKQSSSSHKAARQSRREERQRNEALTTRQRAELELLMLDDDHNKGVDDDKDAGKTSPKPEHFDMKEIMRAEKALSKRHKQRGQSSKTSTTTTAAAIAEQTGDFKIDVQDARFAALYESHEYAIDPTNPRYRDTRGMRAILETAREKRRGSTRMETGLEAEEGDVGQGTKQKKKKRKRKRKEDEEDGDNGGADELMRLVQKVKRKSAGSGGP